MTLSVSAEEGSAVEVSVAGAVVESFVADTLPRTIELELPEGTHSVLAVATDPAGNRSIVRELEVTVDLTPPAAPVLDADVAENGASLTISGQAEAEYRVWVTGPVREFKSGRVRSVGARELFVELPPGEYTATARLSDSAGSSPEGTQSFVVTGPPPPATSVQVDVDGDLVTLTAATDAGDEVEFEVRTSDGQRRTERAADDGGRALATMQLEDQNYTVTSLRTNRHGAVSESSEATDFTVDTVPPELSVSQLDAGADVLQLAVIAEDLAEVDVGIAAVGVVERLVGNGDEQLLTFEMPPGEHVVSVSAVDASGNEATNELIVEVPRSLVVPAAGASALLMAATGAGLTRRRRRGRTRWRSSSGEPPAMSL